MPPPPESSKDELYKIQAVYLPNEFPKDDVQLLIITMRYPRDSSEVIQWELPELPSSLRDLVPPIESTVFLCAQSTIIWYKPRCPATGLTAFPYYTHFENADVGFREPDDVDYTCVAEFGIGILADPAISVSSTVGNFVISGFEAIRLT
ncbi:hypothetical protein GCG54_00011666 [Colletotrichum gloeosporioides]|uniref:Uncharacterized protein n=1 Tax=Colletotrichum gloeosporioides TaxID=474922 RepID=A0A8H4CHG2_COLGL|nr:uncharacterized protein GCG54_00011666 [Colletotrichum gloeosporioides]KAF3803827.1 hypothetical protein GCG54_00011666 [Colletotrichum gloeosporioides]